MELHQAASDLIVGLYRYGRDVPIGDFQRWALERLRELVAFDSAAWGTSSVSPQTIRSVYLHDQPRGTIEQYVRDGWQAKDFLHAACVAKPGVTINIADLMAASAWHRTVLYRRFARPHGIEWALCTVQAEPFSSLNAFVSLWRGDRERPFSEDERRRMQVLMPHLVEAMRANRLWYFSSAVVSKASQGACGMGVCDSAGVVHDSSRSFSRLIRLEWPEWAGLKLPASLVATFAGGSFVGKRLDIDAQPLGDQWLLLARAGGAKKQLGAREGQVAALYASGMDYRAIANVLGLAPATVRNQLQASFRKLGVTSKLDLARRLGESGASFLL